MLQETQVRKIRRHYNKTKSLTKYKVSKTKLQNILSGKEYPWAGGPLTSIDHFPIQRIALTEKSEAQVRQFLFHRWTERWIAQRNLDFANNVKSRYTRREFPIDLSGSCYSTNQFCKIVFDLQGKYISNDRHGFILMDDGSIYDMNRHCNDVQSMLQNDRNPYEVNEEVYEARKPKDALGHSRIARMVQEFSNYIPYMYTPSKQTLLRCPKWATIGIHEK